MDLILTIILIVGLFLRPKTSVNGFLTGLKEGITKK